MAILETISTNVGMATENYVVMILVIGCIIFMAKDFKLGLISMVLITLTLFVAFYNLGWNYKLAEILFFGSIVLLALSLKTASDTSASGGFT